MITIHLTPEDLSAIRFAYSPLVELSSSYRLLLNVELYPPHRRWVDETSRVLHGVDLPYLDALVTPRGYIPDFLTPTPTTTQFSIEDEIQRLLALPNDIIQKNVQFLIDTAGETELRRFYLTYPREMVLCLADELRLYWQRALAPHWQRMSAVLEGDILYRARQLAVDGPDAVLGDLHPVLEYRDGTIQMMKQHSDQEMTLGGDGLQLVPTVFSCWSIAWQIVPEWHPMLIYGARGMGLWRQEKTDANESLELALGAGKARVLQALSTPSNTGELARQLHITAGAVSQQLDRLNKAGLVEPHRSGRRVYYHLTQRGEELLRVFDATP